MLYMISESKSLNITFELKLIWLIYIKEGKGPELHHNIKLPWSRGASLLKTNVDNTAWFSFKITIDNAQITVYHRENAEQYSLQFDMLEAKVDDAFVKDFVKGWAMMQPVNIVTTLEVEVDHLNHEI
jgi:hypothetical protein